MQSGGTTNSRRIAREQRTLRAMIAIYCRGHHGVNAGLCSECTELLQYGLARLDRCPFGGEKPTCARCPIHCYKPAMRQRIKAVMRFAGPRMLWRHPILALLHQWDAVLCRVTSGRKASRQRAAGCGALVASDDHTSD